jgi:hypothetical protein
MPAVPVGSEQSASTDPDGLPLAWAWSEIARSTNRSTIESRRRFGTVTVMMCASERSMRQRHPRPRTPRPWCRVSGLETGRDQDEGVGITIDDSESLHVTPPKSVLEGRGSPPSEPRFAGVRGSRMPRRGNRSRGVCSPGRDPLVTTSTSSDRRGVTWWIAGEVLGRLRSSLRGTLVLRGLARWGSRARPRPTFDTRRVARVRPIGGRRVQ